jgi:hypothetical protein
MNKKIKSTITKVVLTVTSSLSVVSAGICSASAKKVNLENGVKKVTNEVSSQVKPIFASIFGVAAIILLGIALFKTVHEFSQARADDRNFNFSAIIKWWIGVVVCALFSSTAAFGWFGL